MNNTTDLIAADLRPVTLNLYQIVTHIICLVIGLPLNILVAVVLIVYRRLHEVRNTLWLGVIACNLMSLLMAALELVAVIGQNSLACYIYSVLMGKPNVVHMIYLLMATADRHLYMSRPLFHQKYFTVDRVLYAQGLILSGSFFLLLSPYWTQLVPVRCGYDRRVNKWLPLVGFTLIVTCIVAQVKVYIQARRYLAESAHRSPVDQQMAADENRFFAQIGDRRISRAELEATVILVAGVVLLVVFILPSYVFIFCIWICDSLTPGRCSNITSLTPYVRQMILFHAVVNLSIYVTQTPELVFILRNLISFRWLRTQPDIRETPSNVE